MKRSLAVLLLAHGALGTPVMADEPMLPPAAYTRGTPDGLFVVTSKPDPALTSISMPADRVEEPFMPMWFIAGFHRNVVVAANGGSALVLPEGGNLLDFNDPRVALLSFHRPSGQGVTITLGQVMDPATLVPTASHYLWMTSAVAEEDAFVITLVDGAELRIDAATGAVLASPVGATPAVN